MKKISIIGTVGIPAKYGGFETLVEYLVKNLFEHYEFTVFCSGKSYSQRLDSYNGAKLIYINLHANGIQSILYDIISIFKSLRFANTLLILGVSGCIILPFVRLFSNKRIIVNIDGLEWKRDKWGKVAKWFLKLSEKFAVKFADVIVADNKVIQEYVRSEYGVQSQLIAYGANHVKKELLSDGLKSKYPFLNNRYALTVCRIEPENNIHLILQAFSVYKNLNIVIIGNWLNSKYGMELKEKYISHENIFLLDPIYDQHILNQIRSNCYLYIHGHSAGGTNPSLVEAMYLGLPILAFGVEYNKETTKNKALYFHNKDELLQLLKSINDEQLSVIASEMCKIAKEIYIWKNVAKDYERIF